VNAPRNISSRFHYSLILCKGRQRQLVGLAAKQSHFRAKFPKSAEDSEGVYRSVIRAKALDTLRGLLPAATISALRMPTLNAFMGLQARAWSAARAHVRALLTDGPRSIVLRQAYNRMPAQMAVLHRLLS
jgi:hypothetical protein